MAFISWGVLKSWRSKVVAVTVAATVALLIGLVRLTLAVHWFTDVLGGWALGMLWFAVVVVVSQVASSLQHRDAGLPAPAPVAQETRS